ncbi:MAG: hypothetical protein ACLU5I_01725 [Alistipes finegoldii]
MKTTLDGVVFLLPHVSGHAKNGVSPQADFPRTERRARKRHAPFGRQGSGWRAARRQDGKVARQRAAGYKAAGGKTAGGKTAGGKAAKWQDGKVAGRQSGRAAKWQGGKAAKWQDGKVAGRQSGRAARWQDGGRQGGRKRGDCDFF